MQLRQWLIAISVITGFPVAHALFLKREPGSDFDISSIDQRRIYHQKSTACPQVLEISSATNTSAFGLASGGPFHFSIGEHGASVDVEYSRPQDSNPQAHGYYLSILRRLRAMTRADYHPLNTAVSCMGINDIFPSTIKPDFHVRGVFQVYDQNRLVFRDLIDLFDRIQTLLSARDLVARVYFRQIVVANLILQRSAMPEGPEPSVRLPIPSTEAAASASYTSAMLQKERRVHSPKNPHENLERASRKDNLSIRQAPGPGFPRGFLFGFGAVIHHLTARTTWLGRVAKSQSQHALVWKEALHFLSEDIRGQRRTVAEGFLHPGKIIVQFPQALSVVGPRAVVELAIGIPGTISFADVQSLIRSLIAFSMDFGAQELKLELSNHRRQVVGTLRIEYAIGSYAMNGLTLLRGANGNDLANTTALPAEHSVSKRATLPPLTIGNLTSPASYHPPNHISWPPEIRLGSSADAGRLHISRQAAQVPYSSPLTRDWIRALRLLKAKFESISDEPRNDIYIPFGFPEPAPHDDWNETVKLVILFKHLRPNHVPDRVIIRGIDELADFVQFHRGGAQEMTVDWEFDGQIIANVDIMWGTGRAAGFPIVQSKTV